MEATVKSGEVPDEDKVKGSQDDVETGSVISVNRSRKSHSSRSSTSSRVSLEAARARAKAEAAKARLAFTEKESELKIERAKLEARIDYVNLQREAEAAHAEALVLETAAADMDSSNHIKEFEFLPLQENALKRTGDYVAHHALHHFARTPKEEKNVYYPPPPVLTPQPFTQMPREEKDLYHPLLPTAHQDCTEQSEAQSPIINRTMYQQRDTQQLQTDLPQQGNYGYQHDLNNSLIGVLLRFRREPVAVTADIRQMFYCFVVREDCRDFLRFLWFQENDLNKEVVEYRMRVHVFGNSPSPAVAIFGLRRAAKQHENEYGSDARHFVERDFYVDDGLRSFATEAEATDVLRRTQKMLAVSNIKLHKIASNRTEVMNVFPAEERATDIKDLNLSVDDLPVQRSLGVSWNIMSDTFTFNVPVSQKPFTR
ncbi:hypothetical protein MHYP_G00350040 [Metynnis hypsauchen]